MDCGRNDQRHLQIDPGQGAANLLPRPDDLRGTRPTSGLSVIPCQFRFLLYFLKMRYGPVGSRMDSGIMTIRGVAEYLKLTEKSAYRHAADGKTPGFKVGGSGAAISTGGSSGSPLGRRNEEANNAEVECRFRETRWTCPAGRGNLSGGFQAVRIWHGHSANHRVASPRLRP